MQILLNGIVNGGMIALLAIAFSFAYLPTSIFHLALGGVFVLAPYFLAMLLHAGCNVVLATAITLLLCGCVSAACEFVNHRPLSNARASSNVHLVSSLGLYILLSQTAALVWGNNPRTLRQSADSTFVAFGLSLTRSQAYELCLSTATLVAAFVLLKKTNIGLALRGLADNPREMILCGGNIYRLRSFAFFLSGVFASCAAIGLAYDYGYDPNSGLATLFVGAVAMMVGGRQLFWSPVLGGLGLGIVRSEVVWVLSARWQEAATFAVLGLVLLIRPSGLLGSGKRLESQ